MAEPATRTSINGIDRPPTSPRARIKAVGAEILRGDLDDADLLRAGTEAANAVIHLAYRHDLGQAGGAETDAKAIEAFTSAATGTEKRIVITGATISVPGRAATEEDELVPVGTDRRTNHEPAKRPRRSAVRRTHQPGDDPRTVHGGGNATDSSRSSPLGLERPAYPHSLETEQPGGRQCTSRTSRRFTC